MVYPSAMRLRMVCSSRSGLSHANLLCVGVVIGLAWLAPPTKAAAPKPLWATGDQKHLYVLQLDPDRKGFTLLHRDWLAGSSHLEQIVAMRGRVARGGLASVGGQLWLVYESSPERPSPTVQSVRIPGQSLATTRLTNDLAVFQPALPRGVEVRALAASSKGLWALVHSNTPATLQSIDASQTRPAATPPPSNDRTPHDLPLGDTTGTSPPAATAPAQAATATSSHSTTQPLHADAAPKTLLSPIKRSNGLGEYRLLKLDRTSWVKVALPEGGWPGDARFGLVMRRSQDPAPMFVAATQEQGSIALSAYEHSPTGWARQQYTIHLSPDPIDPPVPSRADHPAFTDANAITALSVDGQLVLGLANHRLDQIGVELWVVRPGGVTALGVLTIDQPPIHPWALVSHRQSVALIANTQPGRYQWTSIDLQGRTQPPATLSPAARGPLSKTFDYQVIAAAAVLDLMITFLFWKREPKYNQLTLPHGQVLADLGRRTLAAVVDLLPPVGVVIVVFKIDPQAMLQYWPGQSGGWDALQPGAWAIGLFVAHTTLAELLIGKTLGKAFFAMRVVTLDGQRPSPWRVLVRNGTKALDLVALPLLVFVPFRHRQRLGDMTARTVVVMHQPPLGRDDPGAADPNG